MAGKRPCDEIEMGSVEHVEPAMAGKRHCNGLEMGSAEHVEMFLAGVVLVKECRGVRNKALAKCRAKTYAWCRANSAELATAHSNLDEAFVEVAKRRVGIQLELLNPRVHDYQWQPLSKAELTSPGTVLRFTNTVMPMILMVMLFSLLWMAITLFRNVNWTTGPPDRTGPSYATLSAMEAPEPHGAGKTGASQGYS